MIKILSKSKQTIYAFLSNVIYTFSIWFIAVLINHFYGAETLGEYSFVQALVAPLALFFHLQLKVLATLEIRIKEKFQEYISVYIFSESFFYLLILILGLILKQQILFYAFALFKVFESLNWLIQGYYQSKNDFFSALLLAASRSLVLLIIISLFLYNNLPLYSSFFIIGVVWLLLSLIFDFRKIIKEKCRIGLITKIGLLKPLLLAGASLSVISSFDALMVAIPRYFIKGYFNEVELGKFTMVLQFFIASTIFVVSVGHPFLVKLKNHLEANDIDSFKKEVIKTSLIFLFFSLLTILFFLLTGKFIMKLFWGEEYVYLSKYLTLSMLGIVPLFLSSIFVYAISALRFFSLHLKYYPFVILSALLFGFLLIPKFGIAGAIYSIIFSQIFRMILSGIALKICISRGVSGKRSFE